MLAGPSASVRDAATLTTVSRHPGCMMTIPPVSMTLFTLAHPTRRR